MAEEKKDSKSKVIIILLIVVIILLIGGGTVFFIMNGSGGNNTAENNAISVSEKTEVADTTASKPKIGYETGAVALDENSLQKAYNEALEKTKDGYISVSFQNEAHSQDGENYTCRFGNSEQNTRDMYVAIYLDDNYSEEYYLSGLLRPGQMITNFKGSKVLEPGEYETTLVLTQVEDDHETLSYQTSVVLTLKIKP